MRARCAAYACVSLIVGLTLGVTGCSRQDDGGGDSLSSLTEAAVATVGGILDEQTKASFAVDLTGSPRNRLVPDLFKIFKISSAWAAGTCGSRAADSSCQPGGKRSVDYDCTFGPNDSYKLKGKVTLLYSDPSCGFDTDTQTLTRTVDFTRTGPYTGTLVVDSTAHSNYEGTRVGDGVRLTQVDGSSKKWTLRILGQRRKMVGPDDFIFYNASVLTPSGFDIGISNGLERTVRTVDVGSKVVAFDNVARFNTTFTVSDALSYAADCCYPVSGKLSYLNTGSRSDSGEVEFDSCGRGHITSGSDSRQFELTSCE